MLGRYHALVPDRRRPLDTLDPLAAAQVRLKRVVRALAEWDAYERGDTAKAPVVSRAGLLNLLVMLRQVIREQRAAWRLRTWKRRN